MPQLILLLTLLAGLILTVPPLPVGGAGWRSKVDASVLSDVADGRADFLVVLAAQADLGAASALPQKAAKGAYVAETLADVAERTQRSLLAHLRKTGTPHRSFWVANVIQVEGGSATLAWLARQPVVDRIVSNAPFSAELPTPQAGRAPAGIEWNIAQIDAPAVWALGITGRGAVIGGQDTGYAWAHPALKASYRGWDGTTADHNHNWHDAITSGDGGVCGVASLEPCDDFGHGTHTMGTMTGNDGDATDNGWPDAAPNAIGVAPGARWIGCRNMDRGRGTPATYIDCFQWFIAPTDLSGANPDPALAPHVVNNSWSCPESEGCIDPAVMQQVVDNTRSAGIVVVASAGNRGYLGCGSISTPPSIYAASLTVGATDAADEIASFSARGPVTVDGSGRLKPEISAPGVAVRSSNLSEGGYGVLSGTSMAGPHVAGAVALLIDANPALAGNVEAIEAILQQSAVPRVTDEVCGGTQGVVPNNVYGFGRIDALAAVRTQLPAPGARVLLPAIVTP